MQLSLGLLIVVFFLHDKSKSLLWKGPIKVSSTLIYYWDDLQPKFRWDDNICAGATGFFTGNELPLTLASTWFFWKKHKRYPGKLESLPVFLPQLRANPCSQGTQSRPVTLVFMFHNIQQKGNVSAVNGWSSVTNTDATGKTSLWPLAWWKIARSIKGNTKPKTELAVVHKSTEMCSNTWQQHLKPYGGEKQIRSHIHILCQHIHQVS